MGQVRVGRRKRGRGYISTPSPSQPGAVVLKTSYATTSCVGVRQPPDARARLSAATTVAEVSAVLLRQWWIQKIWVHVV